MAAAETPAALETDERFTLIVNGHRHPVEDAGAITLLGFLRDHLGLTGTKEACGRGECGACTVLVGGQPHLSCIKPALLVDGPVTTVEGLAEDWRDLRQAFAEQGGFQCGFCTSGQIVHLAAILDAGLPRDPAAAERHLRHRLSGNICRCTGYAGIVAAALHVARKRGLLDGGHAG
jgi:carbon-monoxide dehydrogenase small subunit/xanthine dehydrogenase YagT iron-sulfur-binding subunit